MTELMISFLRAHDAIRAERLLIESGITPQVMPLPGQIQSGCGLCLRVNLEDEPCARETLKAIDTSYYLRQVTATATHYTPLSPSP